MNKSDLFDIYVLFVVYFLVLFNNNKFLNCIIEIDLVISVLNG